MISSSKLALRVAATMVVDLWSVLQVFLVGLFCVLGAGFMIFGAYQFRLANEAGTFPALADSPGLLFSLAAYAGWAALSAFAAAVVAVVAIGLWLWGVSARDRAMAKDMANEKA